MTTSKITQAYYRATKKVTRPLACWAMWWNYLQIFTFMSSSDV